MDQLAHYVRLHLVGAAAGIELFGRAAGLDDPEARRELRAIRAELVEERAWLVSLVGELGSTEPTLTSSAARWGERLGRLKPNGSLFHRTPLTDVVDLEAMHDAVASKSAGWRVLLLVEDERLDGAALQRLATQAEHQLRLVEQAHARAARRAFARPGSEPRSP